MEDGIDAENRHLESGVIAEVDDGEREGLGHGGELFGGGERDWGGEYYARSIFRFHG